MALTAIKIPSGAIQVDYYVFLDGTPLGGLSIEYRLTRRSSGVVVLSGALSFDAARGSYIATTDPVDVPYTDLIATISFTYYGLQVTEVIPVLDLSDAIISVAVDDEEMSVEVAADVVSVDVDQPTIAIGLLDGIASVVGLTDTIGVVAL
jgi:hypothetical protein